MEKTYGIIGCGMMGQEHIRYINLLDGARTAAVFDPVPALAEEAAAMAGGAVIAPSIDTLVRDANVDALVIASPNFLHIEQLTAIAAIRTLPILCEKPLFTRAEDRQVIHRLQADYGAPIWVAMEYRYMPPVASFLQAYRDVTGGAKLLTIKEHRIPFLRKIGNWNRFNRNTGGTLVEKCCHFFDLMRLIVGAEPIRVAASAGQVTNHLDENYDGETPDIWDSGYALFDFDNGTRAVLELCMFADGAKWGEEISAVGTKGKIECFIPGPQRFWPSHLGPSPEPELLICPRNPRNPQRRVVELDPQLVAMGDHHGSTYFQHQRFLRVIQGEGKVEVSLEDGARAVEMGLAAQRAAVEQQVVSL